MTLMVLLWMAFSSFWVLGFLYILKIIQDPKGLLFRMIISFDLLP